MLWFVYIEWQYPSHLREVRSCGIGKVAEYADLPFEWIPTSIQNQLVLLQVPCRQAPKLRFLPHGRPTCAVRQYSIVLSKLLDMNFSCTAQARYRSAYYVCCIPQILDLSFLPQVKYMFLQHFF